MTFCWTVFADSSKSDVSDPCPLSAIGYRLLAIGYRLLAIGYRLSAIGYARSAHARSARALE
jgi:hypothetical protein